MKKNLFYLFALICSMSLFTACSEDDEPDYSTAIDQEIVGNYKGTLDVSVGDGSPISTPQKISIAKAGTTSVNLIISNFAFGGMPLGDIKLQDCNLIQEGKKYTCERSEEITLTAPVGKVPADVAIVIEGEKITVSLDIVWSKLPVKVVYTGTRLIGSESSEAKITAFTFDNAIVTEQPVIDDAKGVITFKVNDTATDDDLKELVPTITISDKAVVNPATGIAQDFSAGKSVTYTVIAEEGTVKTYSVKVAGLMKVYTFEDWKTETSSLIDTWTFEIPAAGGWIGADDALGLVQSMFESEGIVIGKSLLPTDVAHSGSKAAKITTLDTHGLASLFPGLPAVPKITSGSLFLGSFEIDVSNTLRSTRFGIEYDEKPIAVKGFYKYTPGTDYYRCDDVADSNIAVLDNTKTDECAISAVLYEVSSYDVPELPADLSDERLNGTNIYSSDKIVASAQIASGAKSEYTAFELNLNYVKPYDASKLYRFAIICSSSKDGDKFSGAPGSTLIVDDISVVY